MNLEAIALLNGSQIAATLLLAIRSQSVPTLRGIADNGTTE
jgi:hypothetical protein